MGIGYTRREMMICAASRYLEDGKTVVTGIGDSCMAAVLAWKTAAPHLVILFETGGVAPAFPEMALSAGDSRTFFGGILAASMYEMITTCARGMVDYAILQGAQIDKYGNINSTSVGDYYKPRIRFTGSGCSNDLGSLCWKTIILAEHGKSRFTEKVNFITTPGYLNGPDAREDAGLPPGTGPHRVITDLGVFCFDENTDALKIESLHPGVDLEKVREETECDLIAPGFIRRTEPPNPFELKVFREEVDPICSSISH